MYIEDNNYERFNKEEINHLDQLKYNFVLSQRFVHVKDNEGKNFKCQTPFLKVLKPMHVTLNKKKTIAKKYIILETNDDLDFNGQIGDFLLIVNKIHEISQEKIKKHSLEWFNTEFDDIGLDIKVRRPIDQQKDNEFIRISIPNNKEIESMVNTLTTEDYILCNVVFKGLKVSNDYITEEWELEDFITQEKFNQLQSCEEYLNNNEFIEKVSNLLDNNETIELEATNLEATNVEATNVEATNVDATNVDATNVDATNVDATNVDATNIEDISIVEVNDTANDTVNDTVKLSVDKELFSKTVLEEQIIEKKESIKSKKSKEKNNKKSINEKILENKSNRISNRIEQPIKKHSKKIIFT